jgi:hypothetical protein
MNESRFDFRWHVAGCASGHMGDVQETLFDKTVLGERGSPKFQYSSEGLACFKIPVPHRGKIRVGNYLVRRRKENEL